MEIIERIISWLEALVWETGIPVGGEQIPFLVIALLGTGIYLTFRLGFIQVRRLGHGFAVATGRYDDPNEPGDVSHFQALTTALSATVGIGKHRRRRDCNSLGRAWCVVLDVDDGALGDGGEVL